MLRRHSVDARGGRVDTGAGHHRFGHHRFGHNGFGHDGFEHGRFWHSRFWPHAGSAGAVAGIDYAAPRGLPSGMGSGAADGEFPREVTHFGGSTMIPAAPTRVVVISTGQLDATLTLGVVPTGSTRGSGATLVPAYLEQAFPGEQAELAAMQDLGLRLEPNLEAIAAATPDLILVNAAGAKDIADQLANVAPTVQTEGTGVNWKQDFLLVADALGKREQAQGVLDDFHETAEQFGDGLAAPPTVSFLRTTADRNRIFGVPSFAGSIAQDAGLARPASQQFDATSEDVCRGADRPGRRGLDLLRRPAGSGVERRADQPTVADAGRGASRAGGGRRRRPLVPQRGSDRGGAWCSIN